MFCSLRSSAPKTVMIYACPLPHQLRLKAQHVCPEFLVRHKRTLKLNHLPTKQRNAMLITIPSWTSVISKHQDKLKLDSQWHTKNSHHFMDYTRLNTHLESVYRKLAVLCKVANCIFPAIAWGSSLPTLKAGF